MFKNTPIAPTNPCPNCGNELQAVKDSIDKVCLQDENVKFDCMICGYRFSYMPVPEHKYEGKSLFCEVCDKHFTQTSALKRHSLVHSLERPFCCEECDKSFKTKAALKRHNIIHTGECPFECSTCKRKFNQISNLRKHLVIHNNNCPFYCKVCGKGFNQLSNMKKHFAVHREVSTKRHSESQKRTIPASPKDEVKTVTRPVLTFVKPAMS